MGKTITGIGQRLFSILSSILIISLSLYVAALSIPKVLGEETQMNKIKDAFMERVEVWCYDGRDKGWRYLKEKSASIRNELQICGQTVRVVEDMFESESDLMSKVENENIQALYVAMELENSNQNNTEEKKEEQTNEKEPVEDKKDDNSGESNDNKKKNSEEKKSVQVSGEAGITVVSMPKLQNAITKDNVGSFSDVMKKYYTVTSQTEVYESDLNIQNAMSKQFRITGNGDEPQILIYHTHSQEDFFDSSDKTIVDVGEYLAKILTEQFGYNVYHDKTTYDIIDGKINRNKAYDEAREGIKKILKDNPSISLVLDIHRDGVSKDTRLVTQINGKNTAQIMFFNGMSRFRDTGEISYLANPNRSDNLALSLQMKINGEKYYPGFTRKNYVNAYEYNLDLLPQCMLIEMGAQTNTYQEVKNAAEPLAMLIYLTLGEQD